MDYASQRTYIRELAASLKSIAHGAENAASLKRWYDVNALRRPDRAPVWCRPAGAWAELLPDSDLLCADQRLRAIELEFRRALIKHDIGDDSVVPAFFPVEAVFAIDPPSVYGVEPVRHASADEGGAWGYEPCLRDEADLDKLVIPAYTYDKTASEQQRDFAGELFGDILPSKIVVTPLEYATICYPAAQLRGLEGMMMDTIENPELLHRLMAYLRDLTLSQMEQLEATGLLMANTADAMYASDQLDPAEGQAVTFKNCFGVGNSQEFDQISPAMWEEFLLTYQKPIYERFGLSAYGCCENLTRKIDGVLSIPNLRVFVCSAWTDLDLVISKTAGKYAVMWRQKASEVCFPDDQGKVKAHLEEGCNRLRGSCYQIVLRELQTLNGDMKRLHKWTQTAKEAAAKF